MPGFWDKFKSVAKPVAGVVSVVVPNTPAGHISKIVEQVIADPNDANNVRALRVLASRLESLETRIAHLEEVVTP